MKKMLITIWLVAGFLFLANSSFAEVNLLGGIVTIVNSGETVVDKAGRIQTRYEQTTPDEMAIFCSSKPFQSISEGCRLQQAGQQSFAGFRFGDADPKNSDYTSVKKVVILK